VEWNQVGPVPSSVTESDAENLGKKLADDSVGNGRQHAPTKAKGTSLICAGKFAPFLLRPFALENYRGRLYVGGTSGWFGSDVRIDAHHGPERPGKAFGRSHRP